MTRPPVQNTTPGKALLIGLSVCALTWPVLASCGNQSQSYAGRSASTAPTSSAPAPTSPDAAPQASPSDRATASTTAGKKPGHRVRGVQTTVLDRLPGTASDECARVGDARDLRAGSMAAGNFAKARSDFRRLRGEQGPGAPVSLYWIPEHADDMLSGLTLTMQRIGDPSTARTITQRSFGTADPWKYYLTEVVIPKPGAWRFEASTDRDNGCFEVTFRG